MILDQDNKYLIIAMETNYVYLPRRLWKADKKIEVFVLPYFDLFICIQKYIRNAKVIVIFGKPCW